MIGPQGSNLDARTYAQVSRLTSEISRISRAWHTKKKATAEVTLDLGDVLTPAHSHGPGATRSDIMGPRPGSAGRVCV